MKFDHPAFAPYRALIDALDLARAQPAPGPDCLDALNVQAIRRDTRNASGLPLRFFMPDGRLSARDYETHILQTGQVPTRAETWHDVLNALVWLRFPRFKAALNAAHGSAIAGETGPTRGQRRDALTVLDESGVWVISRDPAWPALLAERAWRPLFWDHRHAVETAMRFVVVGHALLEKLLAPYPGMTGKCLTLIAESLTPMLWRDCRFMRSPGSTRHANSHPCRCRASPAGIRPMQARRITPTRTSSGRRAASPHDMNGPCSPYAVCLSLPQPATRRPPPRPGPCPDRRTDGYPPT